MSQVYLLSRIGLNIKTVPLILLYLPKENFLSSGCYGNSSPLSFHLEKIYFKGARNL